MLTYVGQILLVLMLVLASFLSYWLVWTVNGLGSVPELQSNTRQERRAKWTRETKQHRGY
jgi:hypothetical protein